MVTRIYDRPDLDQRRGLPTLYVTGELPWGIPGAAYEGRLQIHNAIGPCTVEKIDGDTLPPGHTIFVDNDTMEVVIAWPAYAEEAAPIPNPGFEDGITGWVPGAGWSVTTNNPIAGSYSAVYQRNGGSSVLSSASRYPVVPGVAINAQCQVRQGASSAGNAGAGLRLEFRDSAGQVVSTADGNYVMSASKNAVYPSSVSALPPAGASTVNIACVGVRHRENKDVWVDGFSWDHKAAVVGINTNAVFSLTLRVRDSAGRAALWSGILRVDSADPISVSILGKLTCWWGLDATNGSVMADIQPEVLANGPEGATLKYGSAPSAVAGRTAGRFAGAMNGTQAFVTNNELGPTVKTQPGSGDFCMFGWVKVTSVPNIYTSIVTRYNAGNGGETASVSLRFLEQRAVQGWFRDFATDRNSVLPIGSFPVGQWAFLMLQRRNNKLRTTLNNSVFAPELDVTGLVPVQDGAPIYFGSQGNFFKLVGQLQDWGWIKGKSLTDEEMAWLYNAGAGRTIAEIRAAAGA